MISAAELARLDRVAALLALAGGYRMMRRDVDTLEALSEHLDEPRADFAQAVMVKRNG